MENIYVQIAALALAILYAAEVVVAQIAIFVINFMNVLASSDANANSYQYYWNMFFVRVLMMTLYIVPSYIQLIPSIGFSQVVYNLGGGLPFLF
jgi:hypothetical protein